MGMTNREKVVGIFIGPHMIGTRRANLRRQLNLCQTDLIHHTLWHHVVALESYVCLATGDDPTHHQSEC